MFYLRNFWYIFKGNEKRDFLPRQKQFIYRSPPETNTTHHFANNKNARNINRDTIERGIEKLETATKTHEKQQQRHTKNSSRDTRKIAAETHEKYQQRHTKNCKVNRDLQIREKKINTRNNNWDSGGKALETI